MQRLLQMVAARAKSHWCVFRRGGRPCDHGAVTYLVAQREGCTSGFACDDHKRQMVATGGWRDGAGS